MLQLLSLIKNPRLTYQAIPSLSNARYRFMSDKTKKPADSDKCEKKAEVKKPDCKSEPKAGSEPKKSECKKDAPPRKDETAISGGAQCKSKKKPPPCPPPPKEKKQKQLSCEELVLKREGLQKTEATCPAEISGGGPKCPCTPCPKPPPDYKNSKRWQKISLMGGLPLIAILTVLVFTSHKEEERPEYRYWSHLYLRGKPYFFRDGNTTAFHNSFWNPLPPDGYEDEIDVEGNGKTPETDKERADRLKEFAAVQKEWKKYDSKREAEAKKRQAAAEKEAKKQQELAEKEEKKQMAEAEKEQKRLNAEAEKERKRQEAEAAKENKRQEEEMKKQAKEEAKKVEFTFK
ncbi:triadin-like [Drosophila novamexicana]|uniref:triadin-like n=1 Tax=Drosophila novamexicana TaxID=47314 RepID=UPI0011E5FB91|nr:triadin-like [Drosophila novamexicana]